MSEGEGMKFDIFDEAAPGVDNRRKRTAEALTSLVAWVVIVLTVAIALGGLALITKVIWQAVL